MSTNSCSWTIRLTWPANPIAPASDVRWLEAVLLPGGSIVLGRHQDADARLVDGFASPVHAMIEIFAGPAGCPARVGVRDLDSGNGTYVNGHRVKTTEIREGDRLTIGGTIIKVEKCARTATEKPAAPALLPVNADEGSVRRAAGLLVGGVMARKADGQIDTGALYNSAWKALEALSPPAALRASDALDEYERRAKDEPAPAAQPKGPPPAPPTLSGIEARIAADKGDVRFLLREHLEQAVADREALFAEVKRLRQASTPPATPGQREAQVPGRVIEAAHRDPVLCAALVQWVRSGKVPVWPKSIWASCFDGRRLFASPPASAPASLVEALAFALECMIESKADIMAAWSREKTATPGRG